VQYPNILQKTKVLLGSDYPLITPDRWLADFEKTAIKDEVRPVILNENAIRPFVGRGASQWWNCPKRIWLTMRSMHRAVGDFNSENGPGLFRALPYQARHLLSDRMGPELTLVGSCAF